MYKLILGDCLNVMCKIPDSSIDLVLTDPPYGITDCKWDMVIDFDKMWKELNRITKINTAVVLFGQEPFSSTLRLSNIKNYKYDWVYGKSQAANFLNAKKQPLRNHELISVFYKKQCIYNPQFTIGKAYKRAQGIFKNNSITKNVNVKTNSYITVSKGTRYPKSIIQFNQVQHGTHATQKPLKLIEYLIKTYSNKNDTVLDFAAGSGTTGLGCLNLQRNCILIEKDKGICEQAKTRLNNFGWDLI